MDSELYETVLQQSPPLDEWRRFVYCESLVGQQYGVVDHFPVCNFFLQLLLLCEEMGYCMFCSVHIKCTCLVYI